MELWPHLAARRRLSARRIHPRRPPEQRAMRAMLAELKSRGPLTADRPGRLAEQGAAARERVVALVG